MSLKGEIQMRKLWCVLPAIALALTGLLFMACPDGNDDGGGGTAELEAAIQAAYDARYDVSEADDASEVPEGESWVPKAIMKDLNDAIVEAQALVDNPTTESSVSAAKTKLERALAAFIAAKQQGTAAAITLSGTITAKNKGQIVPYVMILAHKGDWSWEKDIRVPSPTENSPWSTILSPFSEETEIFFRVLGYNNSTYSGQPIFYVDIPDFSVFVSEQDIDEIDIDLSNLSVITVSGTINISYNGQPVPSVVLQFHIKDDWTFVGEVSIPNAGNNTPWSLPIPAFDTDTEILVSVAGFATTTPWFGDHLFDYWFLPNFEFTIKDQNKSGIAINFITLSGTLNISNGGRPVPSVVLHALYLVNEDDGDEVYGYLGETTVTQAGNNTPWSIMFPPLDANTKVIIGATGFHTETPWDNDPLFYIWEVPNLNLTIKLDESRSGIAINLAFVTLSGTINATINGGPVSRVSIEANDVNIGNFGRTFLESPAASAPWSIMLQSDPTGSDIYIDVACYSSEGDWLGSDSISLQNITNLSNIELNVVMLSGTLNVTVDGGPVSSVSIEAHDVTENHWLGNTWRENLSPNARWSMASPFDPTGHTIRFSVYCYSSEGDGLGQGQILLENVTDISNINLELGDIGP